MSQIGRILQSVIDRWIDPSISRNSMDYGRAYVVVVGSGFLALVFLTAFVMVMLLDPKMMASRFIGVLISIVLLVNVSSLRKKQNLSTASWVFCLGNVAVISMVTINNGGLKAFTVPALMIAPLGATLLSGIRWGYAFSGFVAVFAVVLWVAEVKGWLPPPAISKPILEVLYPICFVLTLAIAMTLLGVALYMERRARANAIRDRDVARRSEQAKARFLATISHEIRTPMTGLVSSIDLLNSGDLDPERRKLVEILRSSAASQMLLLNDLLDMSKIEHGGVTIEEEVFELPSLIDEVVELYAHTAVEKGLHIASRIDPDVSRFQLGDANRIRQVLNNLLGNAVKFTEKGRVAIHIRLTSDGRVGIKVTDTGIGISVKQQKVIFDPFTQADDSISRSYGGTGLGLAIAKSLIEAMNGDISLNSTLGQGTEIECRLPLAPADEPQTEHQVDFDFDTDWTAKQAQILLADDNEMNRLLLARTLTLGGHTVDAVNDGIEAIAACREKVYDAIILDLHMPRCDGVEAASRIRSETRNRKSPIFALTADAMLQSGEHKFGSLIDGLLFKPVDWVRLDQMLAQHHGARELLADPTL